MTFTNISYLESTEDVIKADVNGQTLFIPVCEGDQYYDELQRQIADGTLEAIPSFEA